MIRIPRRLYNTIMSNTTTYDALIIGSGPAGLAAALPMARQARSAVVFTSKEYRNQGARHMHMVPGLDHIDPAEFRQRAKDQILGHYKTIAFEEASISTARKVEESGRFELEDEMSRKWVGKKLVLATGSKDTLPADIEGYKENWPAHMYFNPSCCR
jgi:thioredoxin reductase